MGSAHPSIVPYQAFVAGDGKGILIAAGNDRLWGFLCQGMDLEGLKDDPRYATADDRVKNRDALIPLLQSEFEKASRDDWLERLRAVGFPCAPVYTLDEVFSDAQVLHREMLTEMEHPVAGKIKQIGPALKFSETPCSLTTPPPQLGEHTEEILKTVAGLSDAEIETLRKAKAI
jgi:crotonobetainyl-CoA:carnitine CoA-transferase CaiB-like acyl-CoA transferase